MEHFIGFLGLLCVGNVVLALTILHRELRYALCTALFVRVGAALYSTYVRVLPDGTADARSFEGLAWSFAKDGFLQLAHDFPGASYRLYSWTIGLFYALAGRSPLLAQSVSVLAGVGTVYLVWRISRELWDERSGIKAAWFAALFPSLTLYSALTMRESILSFFFLLGVLGLVRWSHTGRWSAACLTLLGFGMATAYHGGMFAAMAVFAIIVGIGLLRTVIAHLRICRLRFLHIGILLLLLCGATLFVADKFSVPYLGKFSSMIEPQHYLRMNRILTYLDPGSVYPEVVFIRTELDLIWKPVVRSAYFLFSPFPWDIRHPHHLQGLIDSLLYLFLAVIIWKNRRRIWKNPGTRALLFVVLALIVVHAMGTGNFGTGIRHRMKFAGGLIVLAAPLLPYFHWDFWKTTTNRSRLENVSSPAVKPTG